MGQGWEAFQSFSLDINSKKLGTERVVKRNGNLVGKKYKKTTHLQLQRARER